MNVRMSCIRLHEAISYSNRECVYLVIPAKAGGALQQRSWSSSDCIASLMSYRQLARLRGGRFVRLPTAELLFFACPKKK
jgi:hypothetical protein